MSGTRDRLWYACYGSNINWERFKYYIHGGVYPLTEKDHGNGCKDKTEPRAWEAVILPYALYYAQKSPSWDNGGVAFLDLYTKAAAPGKMYCIGSAQFEDIHRQEGQWYGQVVELGDYQGYPIKTFTNAGEKLKESRPGAKYLQVIRDGISAMQPLRAVATLKAKGWERTEEDCALWLAQAAKIHVHGACSP